MKLVNKVLKSSENDLENLRDEVIKIFSNERLIPLFRIARYSDVKDRTLYNFLRKRVDFMKFLWDKNYSPWEVYALARLIKGTMSDEERVSLSQKNPTCSLENYYL